MTAARGPKYALSARVRSSAARNISGSDRRRSTGPGGSSRPRVASGAPSSRAMARASSRWIHASSEGRQRSRRTVSVLFAAVRQAVAEADLQALDRFLHRARERQAEAGKVGLVQHDAHVLLGPRHARAIAPLVHRPVLRARVMQRRAQLVGVHAERFAETQPLVIGRRTRPEDQVIHHLADLAGAGRQAANAASSPPPKITSFPATAAASPRASGASS